MTITNDDKSAVLPLLKPGDWSLHERCLCRPLLPADEFQSPYVPWVAFGYDRPATFEFIPRPDLPPQEIDAQLKLVESAAILNIGKRAARWKLQQAQIENNKIIPILICAGDFVAAERILDEAFMKTAHEQLNTDLLAAGIPQRGLMLVTDANQPHDVLGPFLMMISQQYHQGQQTMVSPTGFAIHEGRVVGLIEGAEEAGRVAVAENTREQDDEIYLNTMLSTHKTTGHKILHVIVGGKDFAKISNAVNQVLMHELSDDNENASVIQVVLIPDMTPDTQQLRVEMATLERHLRRIIAEVTAMSSSKRQLELTVQYGQGDPPNTVNLSNN